MYTKGDGTVLYRRYWCTVKVTVLYCIEGSGVSEGDGIVLYRRYWCTVRVTVLYCIEGTGVQ